MRPVAILVVAGVLAFLAGSPSVFGYEPVKQEPTLAPLQTNGPSIDERLRRLETQIQLIRQHLGLQIAGQSSGLDAQPALPDSPRNDDRIGRLENETRGINDRLRELQDQVNGAKSDARSGASTVGQGRLVVQNWTGVPRYLSVNKLQYHIMPGRTDIWVPRVNVEAYLPAYEFPKLLDTSLWRWTGRDYELLLDIRN